MMTLMSSVPSPGGTAVAFKTTTFPPWWPPRAPRLMGLDTVVIRRRAILRSRWCCGPWESTLASLLFRAVDGPGAGAGRRHQRRWAHFHLPRQLFHLPSRSPPSALDVGVTSALNRWGQLVLMWGCSSVGSASLLLLSAIFGKPACPRVLYQHEDALRLSSQHYRLPLRSVLSLGGPAIPRFPVLVRVPTTGTSICADGAMLRGAVVWVPRRASFSPADVMPISVPPESPRRGGGRLTGNGSLAAFGSLTPSPARPLHTLDDGLLPTAFDPAELEAGLPTACSAPPSSIPPMPPTNFQPWGE